MKKRKAMLMAVNIGALVAYMFAAPLIEDWFQRILYGALALVILWAIWILATEATKVQRDKKQASRAMFKSEMEGAEEYGRSNH